jgi:hypothetical protein
VRELVVSKTEADVLARVLLAERLGSIKSNTDSEITVYVKLSVNASEEEGLEGLGKHGRLPVGIVEGVLIGSPGTVLVRGVNGCPVGFDESSSIGWVSDNTINESLDSLPLKTWLRTKRFLVIPGRDRVGDVLDKSSYPVHGIGCFDPEVKVTARREAILLPDGVKNIVVVVSSSSLLERSDTSFTKKLQGSTGSLEVLCVRGRRDLDKVAGTILKGTRRLIAAGQTVNLSTCGVLGVFIYAGHLKRAGVGKNSMVVA